MAFFDFLSRFSFLRGRHTEGMSEDDVDFKKWIQAHRDWRLRLSGYIAGSGPETLDDKTAGRDDCCALGQWIHGKGSRYYGDLKIFQEMCRHHAEFHRAAGDVIRCFQTEGAAAAGKLLQRDFDRYSLLVISDLQNLERTIRS